MSAIVTAAPVIIDPINFARPSFLEHQPYVFPVGDNVYAVLANSQTGNNRVGVYLTTDQGLTWTEQDASNAPVGSGRNFECFFESGTGRIDVCDTPGGAFRITQFNTNTNTWGTVGTSASVGSSNFFFFRQSGGTYVVIYTATSSVIRYVTNIAGVWSGSTILASSSGFIQGGVSDSSDNAYVFHSLTTGSPVHIFKVDSSFAITGPFTLTNTWDGLTRPSLKIYQSNSLAVAFIPGNGVESVVTEIGTPLSALSFTRYPVFTKPNVNESEGWATLLIGTAGDLNIWWARLDLTTSPLVDELDQSVFNGSSWEPAIQYYDEVTNPPSDVVPDPLNEFVHTVDGFQLSDGSWFLLIALETSDVGGEHCTGFFLVPSPECPPETATPGAIHTVLAPNPPGSCIPWTPTTPRASSVFYDLPLEKQGS